MDRVVDVALGAGDGKVAMTKPPGPDELPLSAILNQEIEIGLILQLTGIKAHRIR
jgi:hypothetical protein